MNEYLDPEYSMDTLWSELGRLRPIVSDAQAMINAFRDIDPDTEVETSTGRMIPAFVFLDCANKNMLLANDISAIESAIWWRTHAHEPNADPELFVITFGHRP